MYMYKVIYNIIVTHSCLCYVSEADYTLDDSYWNQESPVGE